jgi:hypothetical protein
MRSGLGIRPLWLPHGRWTMGAGNLTMAFLSPRPQLVWRPLGLALVWMLGLMQMPTLLPAARRRLGLQTGKLVWVSPAQALGQDKLMSR